MKYPGYSPQPEHDDISNGVGDCPTVHCCGQGYVQREGDQHDQTVKYLQQDYNCDFQTS